MFRQVLQQASFRGIKFSVIVAEEKDATTYAVHRFPGQFDKKAVPEKIGPDPRFYPIQAILIGESRYFTLSLLKSAKARKGPGKLIHPTAGMIDAYLASVSSVERIDKLGMIRLKLEFIEAPEDLRSKNVFDRISSHLSKAKALLDDAAARFIEAFSIIDMPAYLVAQTASLVQSVRQTLISEDGIGRFGSAIRNLDLAGSGLAEETRRLMAAPARLAEDIAASIKSIEGSEERINTVRSLEKLPGPKRVEQSKNVNALMSLAYSAIFISEAKDLVLQIEQKKLSPSKVRVILKNLEEMLYLALSKSDYEGGLSLQTFHGELKNWILNDVEYLQKISTQKIHQDTPALILAWKLYGDLSKEGEIIDRQDADNPLKIAGNIEVFND